MSSPCDSPLASSSCWVRGSSLISSSRLSMAHTFLASPRRARSPAETPPPSRPFGGTPARSPESTRSVDRAPRSKGRSKTGSALKLCRPLDARSIRALPIELAGTSDGGGGALLSSSNLVRRACRRIRSLSSRTTLFACPRVTKGMLPLASRSTSSEASKMSLLTLATSSRPFTYREISPQGEASATNSTWSPSRSVNATLGGGGLSGAAAVECAAWVAAAGRNRCAVVDPRLSVRVPSRAHA
mmetsp:Transcript_61450/g.139103  ORF Transcript_61450/g.139103 Transcript_61450/m.139103 type:complete len:243 (+) Transcript_61450:1266-1994(+)